MSDSDGQLAGLLRHLAQNSTRKLSTFSKAEVAKLQQIETRHPNQVEINPAPSDIKNNAVVAGHNSHLVKYIGHFCDHGDGTVTDTRTGLMWMRAAVGQEWDGQACTGNAKLFGLRDAFATHRNFAGYNDWRLPTITELEEIVRDTQDSGLDRRAFPNQSGRRFWSCSKKIDGDGKHYSGQTFFSGYALVLTLRNGEVGFSDPDTGLEYVRLVRDGLIFSIATTTVGVGDGAVLRSPDADNYFFGSAVTLTAQASAGSKFKSWHGDASGQDATCTVTMDSAKTVSAEFTLLEYFDLNVMSIGSASGVITHSPKADKHIQGSAVKLIATPATGSKFVGWHGDASGQGATCTITMDSIKNVSAEFVALESFPLDVTATGTGSGKIDRSINSPSYFADTEVTLTALAEEGSIFNGWHGDVTMLDDAITVTMSSAYSISAEFVQLTIDDTEITAELVSITRKEANKFLFTHVFRLMLRNNGDQQLRFKVASSYVSQSGQTDNTSSWAAGLVNGSKGVTLFSGTFCEIGLVRCTPPAKGDRLYIHVEQIKPSARVCFTFQCIGDWDHFQLISASLENLGGAPGSKATHPTMASALKRIESLENNLAEVLRRLDAMQQSLPMAERKIPSNQTEPVQTLSEVLAWMADHDRISVAALRARLLPLDLLPSAVIDDINERAYDLAGEAALDDSGDAVTVQRGVLLQVLAAWEA